MEIYLVSSDGYLESMMGSDSGDYFAVADKGVAAIIAKHRKENFFEIVRNVVVDFASLKVTYEYRAERDDFWESGEAHLHKFTLLA